MYRRTTSFNKIFFTSTTLAATAMMTWTGTSMAEGHRVIQLDYQRKAVQRPAERTQRAPARGTLPGELRLEIRQGQFAAEPPAKGESRYDDGSQYHHEVVAEARRAALWTAKELVHHRGRRAAFEMGFFDGIHLALDDSSLGRWDYEDGLNRGLRARDARELGFEAGEQVAADTAEHQAASVVRAQFQDLSREPQAHPKPTSHPAFSANLPLPTAPRLEEVFRDVPLNDRRSEKIYGSTFDPWDYYCYTGYNDFYDRDWWNADRALEYWKKSHRSFWRDLTSGERNDFSHAFRYEYHREVSSLYARLAERAYDRGFDRGWQHGALVSYEWHYRRGYHEGWSSNLQQNAARAFDREFPRFYADRYQAAFHEWSTTPHPAIHRVELFEENDDGIYEPGEAIWLDYELVNYGGAPGRFDVRLDGDVLAHTARDRLELPRRATLSSRRPLETTIDARIANRTQTELTFLLADLRQRLPLKVSYPLELDRRVRLTEHDSLSGHAVIETVVRNTSRRPLSGHITLHRTGARYALPPRYLRQVEAGGERRVSFALAGLEPLDLLAGAIEVDFEVASRGQRHDELDYRLPELALNLADRDLLAFMEQLARGEEFSTEAMRRAQELMLRRLRADWSAVSAAGGNGYKSDLKKKTRRTALGDLVWTYQAESGRFRHPEVFTGLTSRIEALAKSAPGTHPFLRRSMKKLTGKLKG